MSDSEEDSDVSVAGSDDILSRGSSSGVDTASGSGTSDSDEDGIIENIIIRQEARSRNPAEISCSDLITDICFHPDVDKISIAYHTGVVDFFEVSDECNKVQSYPIHTDSCRGIDFFSDGLKMVSVSCNGSVCWTDVNKGKSKEISSDPNHVYLSLKIMDSNFFATGDENGNLMLWDIRLPEYVDKQKDLDESINSIYYAENRRKLLCTTGDGELLVYDVRMSGRAKLSERSEAHSSELTSVTTVRNEGNIVCGSSGGELLLFDWSPFDYQTYKPRQVEREISSLLAVSENLVISGYEDGKVFAVHLYPNKVIGLVGQHFGACCDVSKLDINTSGNIVASASDSVKFWNISYLEDADKFVEDKANKKKADVPLPSSEIMSRKDFFSDLNEGPAE